MVAWASVQLTLFPHLLLRFFGAGVFPFVFFVKRTQILCNCSLTFLKKVNNNKKFFLTTYRVTSSWQHTPITAIVIGSVAKRPQLALLL